ncbi:MAG: PhnD/SsuA/transferrin family substrate-binding protein [Sterolibacterium sp.]|nr:PhnD/SsuA/transferrin family substrate-binding protein [Sterolibacterium sp.]
MMVGVTRLLLFGLLFAAQAAFAVEPLIIGVFAFRDKAETIRKFQPLADYLERALPGQRFVLESCTYDELESAIERRQVDFVLSHAAHYVMMSERNALSSPLATLIERENGQPMPVYGGAIIVRADRADVTKLADLKGKTVATSSIKDFANYQMQAYELYNIGLVLPGDVKVIQVGLPIDRSVMAVVDGKADAAFVRMGLIEQMAEEGKLDPSSVKVLNPQQLAGFGYAFSTTLYPQWPFVAMPQVSDALAASVAAALLMLPYDGEVARAAGIWGFTIPANYGTVEEVMWTLRVPPFDAAREVSWGDVWQRYTLTAAIALIAGAIILLLLLWLVASRRRLAVERKKMLEASLYARSLIEASLDPMMTIGVDGKIMDVNLAMEAATGRTRPQLIGSDFADYFTQPDKVRAVYRRVWQEGMVRGYPLALRQGDGGSMEVLYNATLYRNELGEAQGILASARDITELKQVEEALRTKTESLQRSNADLEQFAYSVSHDMRQPLRAVAGHLQLLEKALKDMLDEDSRENLSYALEGARRMDSMIVSLLDYSRVGRKTEVKQWMESRQSLDEALGYLAPAIEESGATLEVNGEWPRIFASRDELTRLLQNLISNAIKYCEQGRPPRVEVVSALMGDNWRVSVRDHGIGIDPQYFDRLFHFFSRLQSRARFDGTGMGLALCKRIVEHHRGRIWVESAGAEQGSTFIFEMPVPGGQESSA